MAATKEDLLLTALTIGDDVVSFNRKGMHKGGISWQRRSPSTVKLALINSPPLVAFGNNKID